jgi:site-specific recombinase XerD
MLQTLLPRAYQKVRALPLLGAVADGFDDWLVANGYTAGSREFAIRFLTHADTDLRKRGIRKIARLSRPILYDAWRELIETFPKHAGTVRTLARYLNTVGLIKTGAIEKAPSLSPAALLSEEYVRYLDEVRGCAASTISHHRHASRSFLDHLEARHIRLASVQPQDIEAYVTQAGPRMCRASLQHEIAGVRGLLRFLSTDGRVPSGLDRQIDTPRLYRLEQLPRAIPWDTVRTLLKSIDTKTAMGLRDHAMFLLIATYGLRASEVVAIRLDDIHWRQGSLRIHQRKTSSPLELPLTNEVTVALVKHLRRTPPPAPHRRIFLRMRAPVGILKPTAITEAFQAAVRRSGLEIPFHGPHCLRHSFAVELLRNGTPLKTIGDILGHRTAESTAAYLRLATGDLREVSLPVPGSASDQRLASGKGGKG